MEIFREISMNQRNLFNKIIIELVIWRESLIKIISDDLFDHKYEYYSLHDIIYCIILEPQYLL